MEGELNSGEGSTKDPSPKRISPAVVLLLALAGVCTNCVFTFRPGVAQCGSLLGFFHSLKRGEKKKGQARSNFQIATV